MDQILNVLFFNFMDGHTKYNKFTFLNNFLNVKKVILFK